MIVVAKEIAPGFMPNKVMSVGSCDDAEPAVDIPGPCRRGLLSKWETQYPFP